MIRSFIYVDQYKLFSLSSQIQGGLINSRLLVERASGSKGGEQKGPFSTGRKFTDQSQTETRTEELWSLHDYAFLEFENALNEKKLVTEISQPVDSVGAVPLTGVVKVTGEATLNDVKATTDFMDRFNEFGEALGYVSHYTDKAAKLAPLKEALEKAQYKREKERIQGEIRQVMRAVSKMEMDQGYLEKVSYVLKQTMGDQLELQIKPGGESRGVLFTSILDRHYLREADQSIAKKYSRRAQMAFTVLGIVTQRGPSKEIVFDDDAASESSSTNDNDKTSDTAMRDSVLDLALRLMNVEKAFTGTRPHEVVLDPIAVYRQL